MVLVWSIYCWYKNNNKDNNNNNKDTNDNNNNDNNNNTKIGKNNNDNYSYYHYEQSSHIEQYGQYLSESFSSYLPSDIHYCYRGTKMCLPYVWCKK